MQKVPCPSPAPTKKNYSVSQSTKYYDLNNQAPTCLQLLTPRITFPHYHDLTYPFMNMHAPRFKAFLVQRFGETVL